MKKICLLFCLMFFIFLPSCGKKDEKKSYEVKYHIDDQVATQTVEEGSVFSYAPSKTGYQFFGWYFDTDYTKKFNGTVTSSIELYARFEKSYQVKLHILDQVQEYEALEYDSVLDVDDPKVDGYKFEGWYKDAKFKFEVGNELITENKDYYAKMTMLVYTITFNSLGGTKMAKLDVKQGGIPTEPTEVPVKLYGEFAGWYTDETLKTNFDFSKPLTSDVTVFASYTPVSYDGIIDEYIPDEITGNLTLPGESSDNKYDFYWSSSDAKYFTSTGLCLAARVDHDIDITLKLMPKGLSDAAEIKKTVTIKAYKLKDLEIGNVVTGYTSTWYYKDYSSEILSTVDVLCLSFAYVYENGKLNLNDLGTLFTSGLSRAHQNGVRVLLSIQGYGAGTKNFSDCAADATLRSTLAQSMVDAVKLYHLDGIDIDWEYPGSADRQVSEDRVNYTKLMEEIRAGLDKLGEGYLLTAAIPAGPWGAGNFEMAKLANIFDWINMMSYDCETSTAGSHHSALYRSDYHGTTTGCSIDETLTKWINLGVPANKICLGMAFYGKFIRVTSADNHGLGSSADSSKYTNLTYAKNSLVFSKVGDTYEYFFDPSSCAPVLISAASRQFRTYDNELSVLDKCAYAKAKGLAGVMIWELGEDETNTLITATAQGMDRHIDGKTYVVGGELELEVGATINLKTVEEVMQSIYSDTITYSIVSGTATLNGNSLKLTTVGTVKVKVEATYKGSVVEYGTMTIVVK